MESEGSQRLTAEAVAWVWPRVMENGLYFHELCSTCTYALVHVVLMYGSTMYCNSAPADPSSSLSSSV